MTRKKGKQPKNKVYDSSKGQRLSYQGEISKSFSQWDVIVPKRSKRSNVMIEKKKKIESNVKLQVMLSSLVGGHICILL